MQTDVPLFLGSVYKDSAQIQHLLGRGLKKAPVVLDTALFHSTALLCNSGVVTCSKNEKERGCLDMSYLGITTVAHGIEMGRWVFLMEIVLPYPQISGRTLIA